MNIINLDNSQYSDITPVKQPDPFGWLQKRAAKRLDSIPELTDFLKDRSAQADTRLIDNRAISLVPGTPDRDNPDSMNELLMDIDGQRIGMTHWSFGQLSGLAKAPAAYLRTLPALLVRDNIEYSLKFNREVEQVKPYFDGTELRSINGPSYGRVDDFEVSEAVDAILDTGRWEPAEAHMGLSVTDQSLNMFLIDKSNPIQVGRTRDGNDDIMYRGLRVINSELGYSSLSIQAFTFRSYCLNGCIFGIQDGHDLNIRHSKSAPTRWMREVQPAIEAYANEDGSKLVDHVERVQEQIVARDNDAAVEWLQGRGLSKSLANSAVEHVQEEEGHNPRSVWDMIQGVTAHARSVSDVEQRADLERVAGKWWSKAA
jgi:hypothetical protein